MARRISSLAAQAAAGLAGLLVAAALGAAPIVPASDAEVVERLPAAGVRSSAQARSQRLAAAAPALDAPAAAERARRLLDAARATGDPRFAGQALALLQPWPDAETAPAEVLLMQATLRQHLHEFDAAAGLLERLLARSPQQAQAWLTLATLRRVQGRYAESDRACAQVAARAAPLHGAACSAENAALRGEFGAARRSLQTLLASRRLDAPTRHWLLTTLAELEQRAGRAAAAGSAFEAALAAQRGGYAAIAYADWLIAQRRDAEVLALLRAEPRSDGVLLRLAIAGARGASADAASAERDMRERIRDANLRPQAQGVHAREQALFALWVDRDARRALELARLNLRVQREPIDVLVLAQAARAAGERDALREARQLSREIGLHDRRLDALL